MNDIILYDYWRSSASYRVRIALNLKGLSYSVVPVNLQKGEHKLPEHLERQPQGLVPALDVDGLTLTQSLAIIEYLDETRPDVALMPSDPVARARVRALSHSIAMEIHPVCNLSLVSHVVELTNGGEEARVAWMQKFIHSGLAAFEAYLDNEATGKFSHGDTVTMADCCLMPQIYNARRWGSDISGFENILRIEKTCSEIPAFAAAYPDNCKPVE